MRTPSGDLHVVDFKTSQIVSNIQPKDYWGDKRHWEIKNNIDTLEFRVFENTDHAATLMQQNLVLKEVRGGRIVPYVITEVEKDSDDRSLMVYASGEWIQLAKAGIIEPQKIESKTLKQCMKIALKGTKWEIGKTEHDGAHSIVIEEFIDPLNLLKNIAASFELEIQYRAEVVGSQIVGRYVDMVEKRGRDTRKEVTFGKDLIGIKRIENSRNICTALLGYVQKENGEFITISEINNGVPYLVDDAAFQRWNEKGKHKFAFYTPQTEDQDMSPQRLMTLMKTEMNKLVNTSVSYEVQAQSIWRTFGLAHELINEGDTIRIIDTGFTPKLYLEARTIAGDESFKDPTQDKYVFGDYREIIDSSEELRKMYQKMLTMIQDKVSKEWFDALEEKVTESNNKVDTAVEESQAAKDLANATKEYMDQNMVDIIEGVNPPTTDLKPNKTLWRDISGGRPGILKIWTGTIWETVVPDVEEIQRELELTNEKLDSKISDKQMHDYIGNLGTTNILINSIFEKKTIDNYGNVLSREPSIEKWETNAGAISGVTVKADKVKNFSGSNSVSIISSGQTSGVYANVYQTVQVAAGAIDYVLSTRIYTNNLAAIDGGVTADVIFYNDGNRVDGKQIDLKPLLKNNEWQLATLKVQAPSTAIISAKIYFTVEKNGALWVAQPQFQQGIDPSTFMPNPKDITNYGEMIDTIAGKVAQSEYNQKISIMDTQIEQNSQAITLKASSENVYNKVDSDGKYGDKAMVERHESQIELNSQEISLRVKEGDIASALNLTAQSALIQADKIYLNGYIEAKHLKAQTLQGVTIQTAPAGSGANQIRLNAQNLTVYGGGRGRGYLGFIERTDGNVQSALILGNDYENTGTLNGSLVIDQTTINSNVFTNSVASIGIATGRNGNDVIKSSYINFYRYDGAMQINSVGDMSLTNTDGNVNLTASSTGGTTGFITMSASKDIYFTAKRGYFNFYTSDNKSFPSMVIKDLAPTNQGDVDFTFANQIMFRVARHPDYVGDGLQVKNATGDAFRDIKLRTLRAEENISAVGQMWAKAFNPTSARELKTNITDLSFSALEKINGVKIQQYNFINDVEAYEAGELRKLVTYYGMIADDTDSVFTDENKTAISLYNSVSISIQAIQEVDVKVNQNSIDLNSVTETLSVTNTRVDELEKELEAQKLKEVDQDKRIAALEEAFQKLLNDAQTTKNTTQTEQP
ncbi:peptidase S74 [Bacillus cereus]|nr:peptidase S74 [Bacillus cereus]PGV86166.1 peptidase S74 [Bacillus cereus]